MALPVFHLGERDVEECLVHELGCIELSDLASTDGLTHLSPVGRYLLDFPHVHHGEVV
eukprot:CAMPEP_0175311562 /NCGR_PEP_ID=MMETSP0093-20121207/66906_1 /TAXON_ID=311494 /ORGANISM="Alexandrium monilatum, Strain CCMP3105" /LENGTH=57 /DNA_ID=CAMNT_0016608189 /DNA_START=411 /DNA_END=580 /DNA_ORIENTATION=-